MTAREIALGVLLAIAAGFLVAAASTISEGLMYLAAGVLLAGWAWLMFGETTDGGES